MISFKTKNDKNRDKGRTFTVYNYLEKKSEKHQT